MTTTPPRFRSRPAAAAAALSPAMAAAAAAAAARERRREQLKRWEEEEEEAAAAAAARRSPRGAARPARVRFERQAEFRAVCAGAELAEARAMVMAPEGGGRALLGGANADGISALHQACIDDNMEVVEFLVESGADVNQPDNEGWTPLHVAAACGSREIAEYLLSHGADPAAVTSDLELPLEVAEDEAMEELLRAELQRRGVDIAVAKGAEEQRMLQDTLSWLDSGELGDCPHPATGASALHVAAAKGYIEVMRLLLAAGFDPNVRDKDGWTPLHAAAHWGVEEACRLLAEHLCDMSPQNNVGQLPCDLADEETLPLLEELQRRQNHLRGQQELSAAPPPPPADHDGNCSSAGGGKHRRSSVSRRSSKDKLSLALQAQALDRVGVGRFPPPLPPPGHSGGGAESDSEGEGQEAPPEAPPPSGPSPPPPPRLLPLPSIYGQGGGAPPRPRPPAAQPLLCRSGSLGAWPTAQATPTVRRSASSPRLQATPTAAAPTVPEDSSRPSPTPAAPSPSPTPAAAPQEPKGRRPFQPPARDEESESQRKARSRLMRQARRATQGVTLTELRAAEQGIGRAAEGRGQEQPIRDEGRREKAGSESKGSEDAPPPPSSAPPPPNGLPASPTFDYQQLFQDLWVENEKIREKLQEAELALSQSRLELERLTQRQERSAERPARLELERFERRALELKAAELEEELKALSDLRADNQRLKDENAALIRVISKLSK